MHELCGPLAAGCGCQRCRWVCRFVCFCYGSPCCCLPTGLARTSCSLRMFILLRLSAYAGGTVSCACTFVHMSVSVSICRRHSQLCACTFVHMSASVASLLPGSRAYLFVYVSVCVCVCPASSHFVACTHIVRPPVVSAYLSQGHSTAQHIELLACR